MGYLVRMPWWGEWLFPGGLFRIPRPSPGIYLSFDDGPHPKITPWVLDQLKQYDAKASFFCIGRNAKSWPELVRRIVAEGHCLGNHTENHVNGWNTRTAEYLKEVDLAAEAIPGSYFRPPYGRIRLSQAKGLVEKGYRLVIWDVLSGDFDRNISGEECALRVRTKARPGSIVVFHDSEKAWERLHIALPHILEYFTWLGWKFYRLPQENVY